ncbi:MAG: hypothetical protein KA419_09765 [Acidobacteria bacterium]|nr:hypothetical protein [Acidobacteriota bacterium]
MKKALFLVGVGLMALGLAMGAGTKKTAGKKKATPTKTAASAAGAEQQKTNEPELKKNSDGEYVFESVQTGEAPPAAGAVDPKAPEGPKDLKENGKGAGTDAESTTESGDGEPAEKGEAGSGSPKKGEEPKPVAVLSLSGSDLQSGIGPGASSSGRRAGGGKFPGNGGDVPSVEFLKAVTSGEIDIPAECREKLRQLERLRLSPNEQQTMRMKIMAEAENIMNAR